MGDPVDLGPYASYRLPQPIRASFGVDTAQELADQIGLKGTLTADVAREAESAYNSYRSGDQAPATAFLEAHTALSNSAIADVLAKLP
jgi:hypothetical protein